MMNFRNRVCMSSCLELRCRDHPRCALTEPTEGSDDPHDGAHGLPLAEYGSQLRIEIDVDGIRESMITPNR